MEDTDPIAPEAVREQLKRMLDSARFSHHKTQSKIFEFLVTSALDGKTPVDKAPSAKEIFYKIFGSHYDMDVSHVRTAINTLRKDIKDYYADEGADDSIIIGLPVRQPGRPTSKDVSYPVTFEIATNGSIIFTLKATRQFAFRLTPANLNRAQHVILDSLNPDPCYLPAELFYIECLCTIAALFPRTKTDLYVTTSFEPDNPGESHTQRKWSSVGGGQLIRRALERAMWLREKFPDNLKVLSAGATTSLLAFELAEARIALSKIDKLEPDDAVTFLPHALYYLLVGQHKKIRGLAERFVESGRGTPEVLAAGFCLYLSHSQLSVFDSILYTDSDCYLAYFGIICQTLMDPEKSFEPDFFKNFERAHERSQEKQPLMPGISVLAYHREFGGLDESPMAADVSRCLEFMGREAPEIRDWIQIAIASLATNQDQSVAALASAVEHRLPLALFLPVWPIFDPLRGREDFKRVLDRLDEIVGERLFRYETP